MRLLRLLFGDLMVPELCLWPGVVFAVCWLAGWISGFTKCPSEDKQLPADPQWGLQSRTVSATSLCLAVMAYMQFVEDYSEPQPSMFYQTPQNEHIYQKKNKYLREVYGINDSFISSDPPQDLAPPPALPPKQRQLVSDTRDTWQGHQAQLSSPCSWS